MVELAFVRGHQDTGVPTVLSRDAWLNVEADALAKTTVATPHIGLVHYKLPGNAWACYAGNQRVLNSLTVRYGVLSMATKRRPTGRNGKV